MLRAVGFHDDDFNRPMIGVASLFSDITPCNAHLDRLARRGCEGIRAGGNDFLMKPFDPDKLLARIDHWTSRRLAVP